MKERYPGIHRYTTFTKIWWLGYFLIPLTSYLHDNDSDKLYRQGVCIKKNIRTVYQKRSPSLNALKFGFSRDNKEIKHNVSFILICRKITWKFENLSMAWIIYSELIQLIYSLEISSSTIQIAKIENLQYCWWSLCIKGLHSFLVVYWTASILDMHTSLFWP